MGDNQDKRFSQTRLVIEVRNKSEKSEMVEEKVE